MFDMLLSLIFTLFSYFQSIVYFYIHLKSTLQAVFHIAQYDYPKNVTENTVSHSTIYKQKTFSNRTTRRTAYANVLTARKLCSKKLPNELLIKIFSHLNQADLFQCIKVSRHWNNITVPLLWTNACPKRSILGCTDIAYGGNTKRHLHHTSADFPLQVARYGGSIVSLDFSDISATVNDCTMRYVLRHCPRLRNLSLANCSGITDESLRLLARSPVASNLLTLALDNCRQITDTGLHYLAEHCEKIEELRLSGCELVTNKGFHYLMSRIGGNVRDLRINNCTSLTGSAIQSAARYCGSRLEVANFSYLPFKHNDIVQLANRCPNMVHLDISMKKPARMERAGRALFGAMDNEQQIHEFGGIFDSLYYLQIRPNLSRESALHLENIMEQRRLRDLVSDRSVLYLGTHMKKLIRLDVYNWTCLTDHSVRFLTDSCSHLETMGLNGCSSITKVTHKYCKSLRSSSSSSSLYSK
ncbi:hypothetical protein BY458DRAFT_511813 [Sporodiniella umbellata]|nr:hypothetical protein BY458DRAFT_511813 [Sporodiniella umbellata]